MAEGMALASLRAETAQIIAEKDADIARLKYDLAIERVEREKLARVGENLGRANASLEGELETSVELLRLERSKTARLSSALEKARAFRDRVDTMRHEMQRGVMIAFNQLSRATSALDGEMNSFLEAMNDKDAWDFDFDDGAENSPDDERENENVSRYENTGRIANAASLNTTPAKARDMTSVFERLATPKSRFEDDEKLSRASSE
jgi:hypothetical protein